MRSRRLLCIVSLALFLVLLPLSSALAFTDVGPTTAYSSAMLVRATDVFHPGIWNNDGDTVKVVDSQGHVVTSYSY